MALRLAHTIIAPKRYFEFVLSAILSCYYLFGSSAVLADEVILTSGEKFTSSKVWEESGKIRFNMHGLVVTVNKSDVAAIIGNDGTRRWSASSLPPSQTAPQVAPSDHGPSYVEPQNKPSLPPAKRSPIPKPSPDPPPPAPAKKVKGIGHNKLVWLMSPADIPGLVITEKDPAFGGIDQYWRPDEKMQLGSALLDGIIYSFWRNRLYSIMMWADGRSGYEHLQKAVFSRYGKGRKSKKALDRYTWQDPTTDRMLQFDRESNTGFLWMRSRKLDAKIKALYPDG